MRLSFLKNVCDNMEEFATTEHHSLATLHNTLKNFLSLQEEKWVSLSGTEAEKNQVCLNKNTGILLQFN